MSAEDIVMDADSNKEVPAESAARPVAEKAEAQKDSVMDDSDLSEEDRLHLKKALRQIEFYFADSNLPYDKFMWTLHTKLPTHWVPLSSVSSFKRMRPYTILFGLPRIAQALKANSTLLEVQQDPENDAEWQVRRRTDPKPPVGVWERSVYAKGFSPDTTQDELEDFFTAYGSTNEIRMRRDDEKNFKGSVFVEFTEESGVDAFLTADPKPKFKEEELVCMTKEEYCTMKVKEKGLTGKAAQFRKDLITRHKFDAFRNTKDASSAPGPGGAPTPAAPTILEYLGAKLTVSPEGTILEEDAIPFLPRATLKFSGEFDNVSFNALKEPLRDLFEGVNPFVKYQRGDKHGYVGFHRKLEDADFDGVKNALKTVDNKDVTWEFISEDEEKAFQVERAKNAARMITRRHEEGNAGRGRGRGRGRGDGRGRGRGRGGDRGRGGRGGRGGGRDHGRGRDRDSRGEEAENAGDKRKRAVEPDGGPDVGVRGVGAPPAIKKTKSEGEAL